MGLGQRHIEMKVDVPDWVPPEAVHYLRHTEMGIPIRALARLEGCHASTILRQIRRFEQRRDDPLIDAALGSLGASHFRVTAADTAQGEAAMSAGFNPTKDICDEETIQKEGQRILRRLSESGAVLAVADKMEMAVVMRDLPDGRSDRTAKVARHVAQAFALKDWISIKRAGKIATTYTITSAGRAALKRMMEGTRQSRSGFAEDQSSFAAQHREFDTRMIADENDEGRPRRMRYNLAESPVVALSRRREKDGRPFLEAELVTAAERLREDFELAQMGPRVAQNWERFLTPGARGQMADNAPGGGPQAAKDRVASALSDLGPGLGDMALRCCCFLEGLEATEKRMGWAARSGKVVLRIALQRLKRHYDDVYGPGGGMIG